MFELAYSVNSIQDIDKQSQRTLVVEKISIFKAKKYYNKGGEKYWPKKEGGQANPALIG